MVECEQKNPFYRERREYGKKRTSHAVVRIAVSLLAFSFFTTKASEPHALWLSSWIRSDSIGAREIANVEVCFFLQTFLKKQDPDVSVFFLFNAFVMPYYTFRNPLVCIESGLSGLEPNDTGYALTLDALPEGDLTFKLCAEENPVRSIGTYSVHFLTWFTLALSLLVLALIVGSVAAVVAIRIKR